MILRVEVGKLPSSLLPFTCESRLRNSAAFLQRLGYVNLTIDHGCYPPRVYFKVAALQVNEVKVHHDISFIWPHSRTKLR